MGLFSSKRKVFVDSVAYNLAGDLALRPNYLRTTISRHMYANVRGSYLGNDIVNAQLGGPTMDQRMFYRWAVNNYPLGTLTGNVSTKFSVDPAVVAPFIPILGTETITVNTSFVDSGDILYWGEQHVADTRPLVFDTAWIVEYNSGTGNMEVTYTDLTQDFVLVPNYARDDNYVIAYYDRNTAGVETSHVYIYRIGSGNAVLDALETQVPAPPEFFPVIPLRLNNVAIDDPIFAADFPSHEKAYKKAGCGKILDMLDNIDTNPQVGDIDYAFLVHGVEINTQENIGRHYIYEFFKTLIPYQASTLADVTTFQNFTTVYNTALANQKAWQTAQANPLDPLFGTPKPPLPTKSFPARSTLKLGTSATLNYKVELDWLTIDESAFAGLSQPGAKVGDYWFQKGGTIQLDPDTYYNGVNLFSLGSQFETANLDIVYLYWQETATTYKRLAIYGMTHEILVYGNSRATTTFFQGLDDPDETGFVIPLHYPTLCRMPLVAANQLSTSNKLMVFNCYQVVKIRWYQRGIFKIVLSVVLTAIFFPAGVGILGANLGVGMALGFTGTAALIAGAVANAVVAMVVVQLINYGAVKIFGDKLGAIIGAIVSFAVLSAGSFNINTGTFSFNWGELMRADNLLGLTNSLSGAAVRVNNAELGNIQAEMKSSYSSYLDSMKEIEKKTAELLGYSGIIVDPLLFTETLGSSSSTTFESRTSFMSRTTLLGSDLADMTFAMISDFPAITLDLNNTLLRG